MSNDVIDTAGRVRGLLRRRGWTIGTAESLSGGALADALCQAPGSSEVFRGGVVAYATEVKTTLLQVPGDVVGRHGVVSDECATAMARGARRALGADVAVSTTGVAGPEPQDGRPVGEVHVAVSSPERDLARRVDLTGTRAEIRHGTVIAALALVVELLEDVA